MERSDILLDGVDDVLIPNTSIKHYRSAFPPPNMIVRSANYNNSPIRGLMCCYPGRIDREFIPPRVKKSIYQKNNAIMPDYFNSVRDMNESDHLYVNDHGVYNFTGIKTLVQFADDYVKRINLDKTYTFNLTHKSLSSPHNIFEDITPLNGMITMPLDQEIVELADELGLNQHHQATRGDGTITYFIDKDNHIDFFNALEQFALYYQTYIDFTLNQANITNQKIKPSKVLNKADQYQLCFMVSSHALTQTIQAIAQKNGISVEVERDMITVLLPQDITPSMFMSQILHIFQDSMDGAMENDDVELDMSNLITDTTQESYIDIDNTMLDMDFDRIKNKINKRLYMHNAYVDFQTDNDKPIIRLHHNLSNATTSNLTQMIKNMVQQLHNPNLDFTKSKNESIESHEWPSINHAQYDQLVDEVVSDFLNKHAFFNHAKKNQQSTAKSDHSHTIYELMEDRLKRAIKDRISSSNKDDTNLINKTINNAPHDDLTIKESLSSDDIQQQPHLNSSDNLSNKIVNPTTDNTSSNQYGNSVDIENHIKYIKDDLEKRLTMEFKVIMSDYMAEMQNTIQQQTREMFIKMINGGL